MALSQETEAPSSLWVGIVLNVAIGLLLVGVIVAVAWRENAAANARARERLEYGLAEIQAQAARLAKDYGWWDEAYQRIEVRHDAQWARDYVGQWLAETQGVSMALGISDHGEILFHWPDGRVAPAELAPLLARLHSASPIAPVGFLSVGGRATLVAASVLRPRQMERPDQPTGIIVFGWDLDDYVLPRLRAITRMDSLREVTSQGPAIPLWQIDGKVVTRIGWAAEQPGSEFLAWVLAGTGLCFVLLSTIAWSYWARGWRHWRALAAANESRIRLLAAISHDLRQPLQSLALFTTVLEMEASSDRARKAANNLRISIDRMAELLEAILSLSRLDMNMGVAAARPLALNDVLAPLMHEMYPQAEAKGLSLRYVPTGLCVVSEPALLGTLVRNLVSNALRYTARGKVLVGCRRRAGAVEVWVCDTGIGIPADKQALIFEEFYQVANRARDYRQGVGLGLAIVDRIARRLGHRVDLRSEPGRGSRFMVALGPAVSSCR